MADSEPRRSAGRTLALDLLAIRKDRKIELKEVLDKTRLADDVIEQLEDSGLIDNPIFNRVYLRSMYSAYGDVVGIERADMMDALESAMKGVYDGRLARKYLGDVQATPKPSAEPVSAPSPAEEPKKAPEQEDASQLEEAAGPGSLPGPVSALESEGELKPEKTPEHEVAPKPEDASKLEDVPEPESPSAPPAPSLTPEPGSVPVAVEPPRPSSPESTSEISSTGPTAFSMSSAQDPIPERKTRVLLPNMNGFIVLVVVAILLIVLAWFAISRLMGGPQGSQTVEPAAMEPAQIESEPEMEPVLLPDSFTVRVLAMTDIMDPVRVTVDQDLTRPYWIDRFDTVAFTGLRQVPIREGVTGLQTSENSSGQSAPARFMAFEFAVSDRIVLERKLRDALVLVEDFQAPETWLPGSGSLDLTRQRLQSWLDSLTAQGEQPPRPDTLIWGPISAARPAFSP